jgi:hypothetical protein
MGVHDTFIIDPVMLVAVKFLGAGRAIKNWSTFNKNYNITLRYRSLYSLAVFKPFLPEV